MTDWTMRGVVRKAGHMATAAGVYLAYGLFAIMPVDVASALGGFIARVIGPMLGVSKRATRNLRAAFPDKPDVEIAAIVKAMWESLGRNAGEVPHLRHLVRNIGQSGARVSVTGMENITHSPDERPMLFFSGHIANWEVLLRGVAELGFVASPVFRHPNNPYLVRLLTRIRQIPGVELVPKGTEGARIAIKVLSSGRRLIMLADQKLNNGIAVPFFGRDAMTAPALARFGLRFDCPIIPLRIERTQGAYFHLTIQAPLELPKDGASGDPIEKIMSDVNKSLESWIRDRPAQWLWLHNRWPV